MTHAKHPLDKHLKKEIDKEVKKGQKKLLTTQTLEENSALSLKEKKKSTPSHATFTAEALIKEIRQKKKKAAAKQAKRSSPGKVDHRESPPASIHGETAKLQKTVKNQSNFRAKLLTKKIEKRMSSQKNKKR